MGTSWLYCFLTSRDEEHHGWATCWSRVSHIMTMQSNKKQEKKKSKARAPHPFQRHIPDAITFSPQQHHRPATKHLLRGPRGTTSPNYLLFHPYVLNRSEVIRPYPFPSAQTQGRVLENHPLAVYRITCHRLTLRPQKVEF